jgi:hypothetical protein
MVKARLFATLVISSDLPLLRLCLRSVRSARYFRKQFIMVNAMQNLIQNELQIQKENIKIEEFTGY